jgi:hypothetical protein
MPEDIGGREPELKVQGSMQLLKDRVNKAASKAKETEDADEGDEKYNAEAEVLISQANAWDEEKVLRLLARASGVAMSAEDVHEDLALIKEPRCYAARSRGEAVVRRSGRAVGQK